MRLIRDFPTSPLCPQGGIVTIGNFDGLHRGHRALLQRCTELGTLEHKYTLVGLSFEPLPQAFFRPQQAPPRLSSVRQKILGFKEQGFDYLWLMRFNQVLAALSAHEFVNRVLVESLQAKRVIVGDDFRFGAGREGDLKYLAECGHRQGFTIDVIAPVTDAGERISSSLIRQALTAGDLATANRLLGYKFQIAGRVVHGQKLGRTLGFPTANIRIKQQPCPVAGVFAVRVYWANGGRWLDGVASLGTRPTVAGTDLLLEVYIFDFDQDIYGDFLSVDLLRKLRDEQHFDNLPKMIEQMHRDADQARIICQQYKNDYGL